MSQAEAVQEDKPRERPRVEAGWYKDLPNDDYHGSLGYSSSQLKKLIKQTPAHLKHSFSESNDPTAAMQLGTAVHSMVLEPENFDNDVAVMPVLNLRTNAGKEEKVEFIAANKGKAIITEADLDKVNAMAASVRAHPLAGILIQDVVVESSVYWWYRTMDPDDDTKYKAMLKVRPDAICRAYPALVDLKTTDDGSFTGFMKTIQNLYYHVSAAMYLEGVNQCKPLLAELGHFAYTKFVFVVVENTAPFLTSVYELSPDDLELGKVHYRRALMKLRDGQENDWPGFPEDIRMTELPGWASRLHTV